MPYEMNSQEKTIWHWETTNNKHRTLDCIGLKYKWWQEGRDVIFDLQYIPNFKKLWRDYVSESKKAT
jgi:hypothetical protein